VLGINALHHLAELLVVDEQVDALALGHLPNLGTREGGVEEDDARAALGGGEERLQEAAVVAGQDGHAVSRLESFAKPGGGQRVHPLVELLVGELTLLVDDGQVPAVADRGQRHGSAEHPVALEGEQHLSDAVGELGTDQARADAQGDVVGLVTEALQQFARPGKERAGIKQVHHPGLTSQT
jgi:hypothetical protein